MLLNFFISKPLQRHNNLSAIESKNKHSPEKSWYIASNGFNPWQNSDQHSHGEKNQKKVITSHLCSLCISKAQALQLTHTLVKIFNPDTDEGHGPSLWVVCWMSNRWRVGKWWNQQERMGKEGSEGEMIWRLLYLSEVTPSDCHQWGKEISEWVFRWVDRGR